VPEGLEAEIWRRAATNLVGRRIDKVWFDDRVAPADLGDALVGCAVVAVRRIGKIVLIDTDGPSLGLHFGMTGRIEVDGWAPIAELEYASGADRPEWDRLRLFTPGHDTAPALRMNDPRRLGRLSLDPDLNHLGPDAMSLDVGELADGIGRRRTAIKSILLDQSVVAGLGNLCADEVLFWAGISPNRRADDLTLNDLDQLAAACRERLAKMLAAGGSTTGELSPAVRSSLPPCPLDGGPLERVTLGGRTAVWCVQHQY
jgi:formamidopyrimidine-DNA glycosylase